MRLPLRLPRRTASSKLIAAVVIALLVTVLALAASRAPGVRVPIARLDEVLYDSIYRLRPMQDRTSGPLVIVAVDDNSLKAIKEWPWRREYWGHVVTLLNKCGAKAIVLDLLFSEPSLHSDEGDDDLLAEAVNNSKVPVVFASLVESSGNFAPFAPPVEKPVFGAANVSDAYVFRSYSPFVHGQPSIAAQAARAMDSRQPISQQPFFLHYYGPHQTPDKRRTFRYLSAANVVYAAMGRPEKETGINCDMFRGKVVLIGAITAGTFDLKASPLSLQYPGVEVQATAIENVLAGQYVHRLGLLGVAAATFCASLLAAIGVVLPRRVIFKLAGAIIALVLLLALAMVLFQGRTIQWLPLAPPLLALVISCIAAFAWSYFTEDRQRRVILKALSQYVSPEVAEQIARDPTALSLGGERREMTVMFTDIAGFTDLSETLSSEKLSTLLNYYLEEMSSIIFSVNGTVDKYIGDAIMSFWNAPLGQPDHAIRACTAALRMREREAVIQGELAKRGATRLLTRIGINSGEMHVGNMGSSKKFNYTVLGDAVNLGSRLEGANKLYGSTILMAESTAKTVQDHFIVRQLDVLRVKGKLQPMAVYELMAEQNGDVLLLERKREYEAALQHYMKQRWDEALALLRSILARFPTDLPAEALLHRVEKLRHDPPAADWDGVYVAKEK